MQHNSFYIKLKVGPPYLNLTFPCEVLGNINTKNSSNVICNSNVRARIKQVIFVPETEAACARSGTATTYLVVEGGIDAAKHLHPSAPVKVNLDRVHVLGKLVATETRRKNKC